MKRNSMETRYDGPVVMPSDMLKWIRTIGIIRDSDGETFKDFINSRRVCIRQSHDCSVQSARELFVINIPEQELFLYCKKNHLPKYLYCNLEKEEGSLLLRIRVYIRTETERIYFKARKKHRKTVSYPCTESVRVPFMANVKGMAFNVSMPIDRLMEINETVGHNLHTFNKMNPEQIFDFANFRLGLLPYCYRGKVYRGLF